MTNNEKNIKKIVGQSSYGILTEVVVPTIIISIVNLITKSQKTIVKIPAIVGGFVIGNHLGKYMGRKIMSNDNNISKN